MKIGLDAGHGKNFLGRWTGAASGGLIEDQLTFCLDQNSLGLVNRIAHCLRAKGIEVVLTRESDKRLAATSGSDLKKRADKIRDAGCDLFLSVHFNASEKSMAGGFEIFVNEHDDRSYKIASGLERAIVAEKLGLKDRGVKWDDKGAHKTLYLLDKLSGDMPSMLLEAAFITSPNDRAIIFSRKSMQRYAEAVADYIEHCLD